MCQCPKSGRDHFYSYEITVSGEELNCVNALSRAGTISTVPFQNPHKYWAHRAVFARNCLTIQKLAFFSSFLCFFVMSPWIYQNNHILL